MWLKLSSNIFNGERLSVPVFSANASMLNFHDARRSACLLTVDSILK